MKKLEIKPLYITVLTLLFQSACYLIAKLIQGTPNLIGSTIDERIPFNIYFIIPYVLWYLFVIAVPYFYYIKDKETFKKYTIAFIAMSILANTIFVLWPTTVSRPDITENGLFYEIAKLVFAVDTPILNCFPSLHCAVSFIWIPYTMKLKNTNILLKISNIIISILIIASTLFIKQHVFIDMTSGIALSLIVYVGIEAYYKYKKSSKKNK